MVESVSQVNSQLGNELNRVAIERRRITAYTVTKRIVLGVQQAYQRREDSHLFRRIGNTKRRIKM